MGSGRGGKGTAKGVLGNLLGRHNDFQKSSRITTESEIDERYWICCRQSREVFVCGGCRSISTCQVGRSLALKFR